MRRSLLRVRRVTDRQWNRGGGQVVRQATRSMSPLAFSMALWAVMRFSLIGASASHDPTNNPDLLIKRAGDLDSTYALDNEYQVTPSGAQIETQTAAPYEKASYQVVVQNDGDATRSFLLTAQESEESGWTVLYRLGTLDITEEVLGGGHATASLAPGESETITVDVIPSDAAIGGTQKGSVLAVSPEGETGIHDAVEMLTTVALHYQQVGHNLIADQANNRVIEVDLGHVVVWQFQGLNSPRDAIPLDNGLTLITDTGNHRVLTVDEGKNILSEWKALTDGDGISSSLRSPADAFPMPDGSGNILITDYGNHRVIIVDPSGTILWQYGATGLAGSGPNRLRFPCDAKPLRNQNVLITDQGNHRVIEVDRSNNIRWQYGKTGVPGSGKNQLRYPYDAVRLSLTGVTLITDTYNYRVIKVDRNNNVKWQYGTTGTPGSGYNQLNLPGDANAGPGKTFFITDSYNHRIIEVSPSGSSGGSIVFQYGRSGVYGSGANQLHFPADTQRIVTSGSGGNGAVNPDLLLRNLGEPSYSGNNVYESENTSQAKFQVVSSGSPARYEVKVENDGNALQSFVVRAEEDETEGWTVAYFVGTVEVTAEIHGPNGHATVQLAPGAGEVIAVVMTPAKGMPDGAANTATLSVYPTPEDVTPLDSVRTVTSVSNGVLHDVAVTRFSVDTNPINRGATATFSFTIKNQGNVSESGLVFRLIYNNAILGQVALSESLGKGQSFAGTLSLKIGKSQAVGDYFMTGEVPVITGESLTSNNSRSIKLTVK
ncbi:MAG: hypothetical protein HY318_07995 [Armatimonadetes bacterium]|nr:hypothetical protein [Armatimonadota bacterium]